ncbi:unnamed protein product [Prorocentrum cordatum]|uniref:Phospholipase B-like n=1 Tax=Prorocentrum cordatum TaxID=2364126 RepID=A0ABN9T393_9DINO|nr:unnamed protein product [Polarella glacialis]
MLARAAALAAALSLSAEGLALQSQQPELAQAGGELAGAEEAKGEWPWGRHAKRPVEEQQAPAPAQNRVAVLVSGSVERLLLSPLLTNVVRPNALKGLQVDLFFRLTAPTKFTKGALSKLSGSSDPKIATLLQTADETSFNSTVMDFICTYAESHLAASCQWDLETSDALSLPPDLTHRQIMTQTSPLDTTEGKEAITRWRSLSRLWTAARAKAKEMQEPYTAVLATREDDYWLAPRLINIQDFQLDSMKMSVTPCLHSSGVHEKTVIMGHDAADVMLRIYQAWQKGDMRLEGTRTAEEAWFRLATESELNMKPEPMNAASASYTHSGLPCFQEGTFNLKQDEDYEQCFAESAEDSPITDLFRTFSCETMSPWTSMTCSGRSR